MRAPRFESEPHQRAAVSRFNHAIVRHGALSGFKINDSPHRRIIFLCNRQIDRALARPFALDHRKVFAHERVRVQLLLQALIRVRMLRCRHQTARSAIEPVQGSEHKSASIASGKAVFQRSARLLRRALARERRRFFNDQNIVVLIGNGDRFELGLRAFAPVFRKVYLHAVARIQRIIGVLGFSIDANAAFALRGGILCV